MRRCRAQRGIVEDQRSLEWGSIGNRRLRVGRAQHRWRTLREAGNGGSGPARMPEKHAPTYRSLMGANSNERLFEWSGLSERSDFLCRKADAITPL